MSKTDDFFAQVTSQLGASAQNQQPIMQTPASPEEDAEAAVIEERRRQRSQLMNELALQTTRDRLSNISSPLERKRLESRFTIEQKMQLLENNTIDKYHGLDGFQRMRWSDLMDGDSGWVTDKDGNRHEIRVNTSSSTRLDTPDIARKVGESPYKQRHQPEAVARASGKSVNELTDWDYKNYDVYAQNEMAKRLASHGNYQPQAYDPTHAYRKIDVSGLEVLVRFDGEDAAVTTADGRTKSRKIATILNPYTQEDIGYSASLDPSINTDFSLFRSLRTAGNARKALTAQRLGEFYRDEINPENGYVDDLAAAKRIFEENKTMETPDNFAVGALKQLGGSALSTVGGMAVAVNDTLGGSSQIRPGFDLRRYADREAADITVGKTAKRRDEYNAYMQNVSSKFESGDIVGGLWEFIKHPTQVSMFVAEQLGNMAPGLIATAATGGAGAASFGAATATDLLANIGMDFMEFRKNHGRSMDASEMAKAYLRQLPAAMLDALSDKILVGNSNVLKTARYTPLRAAGEVAKEMGVEGTQEVVQNIASQMNAEDKSLAEAAADPSNISNFMLGALGGGLMSGPVGSGQIVGHYIKQANYDRIRQQYGEDYDKTTYHDGDTLREDHKAVRENLISSTRDSFDKAKESTDVKGMISNIGTLNNEIKNTQSGLSKRDVDHMRTSLYDMISDMVATTAAKGLLSEDLNNVLQQLQDSLGVENNEQLKKELARYAEVYGSAAVGDKEGKTDEVFSRRNLASSNYYENASDVENRAQRFEDLIQNLGGTKAEARKLLEEVAEENINDKNEGFNSSLIKAKQAQEEGNTDVYDSEVRHMTDRVKSMVMKMQDITEGLRSNMNKGATTDSRGFLSDDKFTIQYGNEKDSSRRGEKAQFRTSFKKEAFNYSTRGGLFRTTDQIASEARYMAEQLDSLNLSDKQKAEIKQQLDLLQEYENDINHIGYELHRGIRGGFNYEADTDGEAVLSEGETAKIKGAMEDYFHQYVTPNTGEKRLSPKEAVDLKKYVNTLSLGQFKAFQKSLDKQKDSIAYEGVSAAIKARESAKGVATSHAKWRGTHYQNGKYIRSLVKTTQTTEKGNEAKIDNMVNGTHVDAVNNANILEAHHEQLQQRIAKLEAKKNRTKREEKKLNELKTKLKNTKERLGTLERVSNARAKTIYNQNVKAILENPTKISELIAQVYNANKAQDAKVNVRAIEKAIKMLRDTLHDASSMETDKAKLKDAKKALELLDKLLKRAEKTDRVLEGRDTIIHRLIDICSKENLRNLSDINFLKALKQSMEKFKDKLGDRLEAYKGPYKEALYNLAYKIRLIERSDEKLARGIIYDINHNGDLDDLRSRAVDYEKKIAKLQAKNSLTRDEEIALNRYKQYSSAIAEQAKKLEDRANEFENKLPDRPDIFAINSIDELENVDRTLINSLSQLYDPKSEFYGNKLAIQKVMEVRKDIQTRIAELSEKQDTETETIESKPASKNKGRRVLKKSLDTHYSYGNDDDFRQTLLFANIVNAIQKNPVLSKMITFRQISFALSDNFDQFISNPDSKTFRKKLNKLIKAIDKVLNHIDDPAIKTELDAAIKSAAEATFASATKDYNKQWNQVYKEQLEEVKNSPVFRLANGEYGKITYAELKRILGTEKAKELRKKLPKVIVGKGKGTSIDVIVSNLRTEDKTGDTQFKGNADTAAELLYETYVLQDRSPAKEAAKLADEKMKSYSDDLQDFKDNFEQAYTETFDNIVAHLVKVSIKAQDRVNELINGSIKPAESVKPALTALNIWHTTGENANLSNLALRPFDYEGRHYQSVEHAYQSLKSGSFDEAVYSNSRWSNAGTKIQGRKGTDTKTNLQLMKNLILESFKQNDSAKKELLSTGDVEFTHVRPNGSNGIWETEFPRILKEVREELRTANSEVDNSDNFNTEESIIAAIDKYTSELDESLSSEEIQSIIEALNDQLDIIDNSKDSTLNKYWDSIENLINSYKSLLEDANKRPPRPVRNPVIAPVTDVIEDGPAFFDEYDDSIKRLKEDLIKAPKKKDKVDKTASVTEVFPIGGSAITNWFTGKLTPLSIKFVTKAIKVFKAKKAGMDIMGDGSAIPDDWQNLPIADIINTAVSALENTMVQYELTDTLASDKGKHYKHLNGFVENILRKNPHLQLIYKPTVVTSGMNRSTGQNFVNIDGVGINPNTAMAIYMAVTEFFANRSVKSMLNPTTRDEVAAAFGTTEDAVDPAMLNVYSRISSSWGVFRGPLKNTLGKLVMDYLGITKGANLDNELSSTYANAEAALGDIALLMAEHLNWITINDVYRGDKPVRSKFSAGAKGDKEFALEMERYDRMPKVSDLGIDKKEASKLGLGTSNVLHFYKYNDTTETANNINSTWLDYLKSYKTGEDTLTRTPVLRAEDTHLSAGRRKQEKFRLTKKRVEVLKKESQAPYHINIPVMKQMLAACGNSLPKFRKTVLERMGYDPRGDNKEVLQTLSYDEQQKIKGKNESLARELDYLIDYTKLQEALEMNGEFHGYFFSYFGSANGRSFIDSNTMNPQTAKTFTRFMCQPKTTEQIYDLNNASDIQCELFAIAQAFDCLKSFYRSGDNKSHNGASLAGKLLGLDVIGNYEAVEERLTLLQQLQRDLVTNSKKQNEALYKDKLGWDGTVENFGQACVAIDHCVHRLEAILENNGIAEGAAVSSYLAVENDSTTSGYVIKFLLMPLDKELLAQYGLKVGFLNQKLLAQNPDLSPEFRERLKNYTSIDELKTDPDFLDIYKTAAIEMVKHVEKIKSDIKDNPNMTLGDYIYYEMCNDKDSNGMPTGVANKMGIKLRNSGLHIEDLEIGAVKADNGIPKPDPVKGVSSILRNLMKPIVMIFGYNASKDSLIKQFSKAVMDDHIANFMALVNGNGLKIENNHLKVTDAGYDMVKADKASIDSIISFIEDIAVRVSGDNNRYKAVKTLANMIRNKSPYSIRFVPANAEVSEDSTLSIAEWYNLTVGGVYGKAVTNFLDEKFGSYGEANKLINDVSKLSFKIYSSLRDKLLKNKLKELATSTNVDESILSRRAAIRSKYGFGEHDRIDYRKLDITDLTTKEVKELDDKLFSILPSFPMPEGDGINTNIRSVETASRNLDKSNAFTPVWRKNAQGKRVVGQVKRSDGTTAIVNDTLNSFGDLKDFASGDRMLAVLLIHFTDGVIAEHTMDHMLSNDPALNRFLTVVHDAFVVSAKDSKNVGIGFNEALFDVCKNFNPFGMLINALHDLENAAQDLAVKEKLIDPKYSILGNNLGNLKDTLVRNLFNYATTVDSLKSEYFSNTDDNLDIVLANLGGDAGAEYVVSGNAVVPVSNTKMSSPTIEEKASIQQGDALGSRASAWKDKYDIQRIEQEANSSKEGRTKIFQSLNEWDEAEGPVKNDEEYLKQAQELLNEINPERFTNLQYEEAVSQQDAEAKGVYFTGRDGSQRRVTVIKSTAIANEADRKNRLASRQLSAAAVYMHEMIHPAVSEAVANPDLYGVTREVSALREFYNAVADKIDYTFFRPDNYDSLTEAEKKLADESAQKYYDYMFNSTDKDTLGGFQEFIANALSDPRMIELLKGMDASAYSEEYRGKNFFEKIFYIVKHIFKAMFGNEESKGKVLRTMGTLGLESKRQGSIYDAMRNLTVQISYTNAYAVSKMQNGKLSKLENVFEALNSAAQVIKPVNDYVSDKIKWAFDLGGVSNRFERTYKSLEDIIRAQGITEGSSKLDTLKTLLMCPFSHNMRVALADTLIDCCSLGQRSTFAHFIRDISDKDDATRQLEGLASLRNNIDRMSRGAGAAYAANILDAFGGTISDEDSIACTKIGVACDLQSLLTNGYSIEEVQKLSSGDGIEEAIASHEAAIAKFYENDRDGEMKTVWTRNQCIGLAHFMNTNKGNPAQCLNAYAIARGFLCSKKNKEADEKLIGHIDCLASLIAMQNADPSHRLAISKMNSKGLKTVLECHRSLIGKTFDAGYIERAHMIKGWHSSIIDDTKDYAVAPVDPATVKAMADDGYKLHTQLPVDGMTDASMGFYIKSVTTPQHRQGAALQITGKRAIGQSLNSFMESNEHIIGDRRDYITKQIKKAHFIRTKMQARMETLDGLSYEDFDNRGLVGSYYTPVINPNGDVTDFRITMFNDFKDAVMNRNNNICDVMSKMAMTNTVKTSAGGQNTNIVHFLIDDMEKNMDPDTHRARRQFENLGEVVLGSKELRNKHDIKYVRVRIDPDSEFAAPDVPAAIIPEEMREAMRRLEKNGDGLWVREDWLYQIFGTPDISLADAKVMQKENMRAARFGIRLAENIAKAVATLAKVAIVFKKPQVLVGNAVSNYLFHIMNGHNPVTAAAMDTENLQLVVKYMQTEKEINRLDIKKDIGEATESEKAKLNRLRSALENNPIHKLVQAGLFSAVVEDNSKKDQDAMKAMLRYISDNPKMQKVAKSALGDAFDMKTVKGKIAGQLYMREGTPLYDFIYAMTQYSDFVSRCTDYRIGMKQMPESFRGNSDMKRKYETALIQQIRDDYINYDSPQSKAMNYVNAVGLTFFTKYFFRIQRVIRRTTTRRPLMAFSMMAANAHFDMPDNIFEQMPLSKNYGAIFHTPWSNAADLVFPPAFGAYNPANWWPF